MSPHEVLFLLSDLRKRVSVCNLPQLLDITFHYVVVPSLSAALWRKNKTVHYSQYLHRLKNGELKTSKYNKESIPLLDKYNKTYLFH